MDTGNGSEGTVLLPEATEWGSRIRVLGGLTVALDSRFRMAVVEVLIDHMMSLDERRQQRTATTWPDESDLYTATIMRLNVLFKKRMQAEGWTPPPAKPKRRNSTGRTDS